MLTEVETGLPTTTLAGQPITPKCLMLLSLLIEMVGMLLKKKTLSELIPFFIQSVLFILYYLSPSPKPCLTEDVTSLQVNMTLIWRAALQKALKGVVQFHWPTCS